MPRKYPEEFKRDVVAVARRGELSVVEIAADFGLSTKTIYRWLLTIGPLALIATMSGSSLAATTGISAGILLLMTAAAGFHDLAGLRPARAATPVTGRP